MPLNNGKTDLLGAPAERLKDKKLFLFDMDGTVYIGKNLFDGVKELLQKITDKGGVYSFITNNSSKSRRDRVEFMNSIGIPCSEYNFMTSTMATAEILSEKFGKGKIYVQATETCVKELTEYGLNVTTDYDESVCAILVGFDTELTHAKMLKTCKMLTNTNVPYYATNPDWTCPVEYGYVPDCGSMCFGYSKATGKTPVVIGKPNPYMIDIAEKVYGFDKSQTLVIGDRVYTDIASGVNAETDTLLVLSGEGTLNDITQEIKPTFVLPSVKDLTELI